MIESTQNDVNDHLGLKVPALRILKKFNNLTLRKELLLKNSFGMCVI